MKIVGVTSCVSGLAHTPMAAAALTKAGKALGIDIKIEQQGAMGFVDELSQKEVDVADVVIFAVDRAIEKEERFEGKKIVKVKLGQCISSAEVILTKIKERIESED